MCVYCLGIFEMTGSGLGSTQSKPQPPLAACPGHTCCPRQCRHLSLAALVVDSQCTCLFQFSSAIVGHSHIIGRLEVTFAQSIAFSETLCCVSRDREVLICSRNFPDTLSRTQVAAAILGPFICASSLTSVICGSATVFMLAMAYVRHRLSHPHGLEVSSCLRPKSET